jgi:coiled-coil and C2 domain-containing protein 1
MPNPTFTWPKIIDSSSALEAKRAGQIEQAKEYLRQAKGFDKLIEATKCGLPVDIHTIPIPPQDTKG